MVAMLRGGVREVKVPEPPGAEGLENRSLRVSARTPVTSALHWEAGAQLPCLPEAALRGVPIGSF